MNWVGLDIGGANIKIAGVGMEAVEIPFPMWTKYQTLPDYLRRLLAGALDCDGIALTMTGELADCFQSKGQGVTWIVDSVVNGAADLPVKIYRVDGSWCGPESAKENPLAVAASNWHALAVFASRFLSSGNGFLIDIGSTTTDIIPVSNRRPRAAGDEPVTDIKRLAASQLVYTGVWRSSLSSLLSEVEIDGNFVPLANELFATMADAYLWKRMLPEAVTNQITADSRPATRVCASQRLARTLCCDVDELTDRSIDSIADAAIFAQRQMITAAIQRVVSDHPDLPQEFVVAGSGSWLAVEVLMELFCDSKPVVCRLNQILDEPSCRSAAAYAVMQLANEQIVPAHEGLK
jgi:probable H4MPT-linked C1 transfer pathway protein